MKMHKIRETTDNNKEYTVMSKKIAMRMASAQVMEYSGNWGYMPNCNCGTCKYLRGKFNSRGFFQRNRSWKKYRKHQWKSSFH